MEESMKTPMCVNVTETIMEEECEYIVPGAPPPPPTTPPQTCFKKECKTVNTVKLVKDCKEVPYETCDAEITEETVKECKEFVTNSTEQECKEVWEEKCR